MAYNVSYSTLPAFTSNSIGFTASSISFDGPGNTWVTGNELVLSPGVYVISGNFSSNSSYNTFSYIVGLDTSGTTDISSNSIWFNSSGSPREPMSYFTTAQGSLPSSSGEWNNYLSWYPIAGGHYLADTGLSYSRTSAIQLSTSIMITVTTSFNILSYVSSSGNHYSTISAVRIS